jgi:dihydrodipicolinate synthase/N-acetylneuraminate lyase
VFATVSNLMPHETHELMAAALAGEYARSRELNMSFCCWCARCWGDQSDPSQAGARLHGQVQGRGADAACADVAEPAEKLHAVMKELRLI